MLKLFIIFAVFTVAVTAGQYRKSGQLRARFPNQYPQFHPATSPKRSWTQTRNREPYPENFQVDSKTTRGSDRMVIHRGRIPILQYNNAYGMDRDKNRRRYASRINYYNQDNRKQDFGFGNRFRKRASSTTIRPKRFGPRPLAVFN